MHAPFIYCLLAGTSPHCRVSSVTPSTEKVFVFRSHINSLSIKTFLNRKTICWGYARRPLGWGVL
ncbi:hypothetical protein HMPREF0742_01985 [Rothia aeria F0184]|uniref:Uncharacterized protein n=1 Tax=Rothia aeria F0184 TaxID=888019 RepID=U7V0T9_9MICC|nr:hypothetical protein HMPREF0742_01985 [Rothia aeria F0184]